MGLAIVFAIDMAANHAKLFEQELKDVYGKGNGALVLYFAIVRLLRE